MCREVLVFQCICNPLETVLMRYIKAVESLELRRTRDGCAWTVYVLLFSLRVL